MRFVMPSPELSKAMGVTVFSLVRTQPLIAFLAMSCDVQYTHDVATMATTTNAKGGPIIVVNPKFFMSLPEAQRSWGLLHVMLHMFLQHAGRQTDGGYDPRLWDIAADYVVNLIIACIINESETNAKLIQQWPRALVDERFAGMTVEQVYEKLLQKDKHGNKTPDTSSFGAGVGEPGDNTSQKAPFDKVPQKRCSAEQRSELNQLLAGAIAMQSGKQAGTGTNMLLKRFKELLEPVVPWHEHLAEYVIATVSDRQTYNRPSRRNDGDVIFPSRTGERLNLWYGVDSSGSMSEKDNDEVCAELISIAQHFTTWNITVLSCDTVAHILATYSSDDGDDAMDFDPTIVGGGGTNMDPMIRLANEADEPPDVLIIGTDGYIPTYTEVDAIPVITVVTRSGNKQIHEQIQDSKVIYIN